MTLNFGTKRILGVRRATQPNNFRLLLVKEDAISTSLVSSQVVAPFTSL
jgi:hypothetical protein